MREFKLFPKRVGDYEEISYNDLLRGFANVLMWAADSNYNQVAFEPGADLPLTFVDNEGREYHTCENIVDPPRELHTKIKHCLLRAISHYHPILFRLNLLVSALLRLERHALVEIVTDRGSLFWYLRYAPCRVQFELKSGYPSDSSPAPETSILENPK